MEGRVEVPRVKGVLAIERVGQEAGGAEVDGDGAGVDGSEVVAEAAVFQGGPGVGVRALKRVRGVCDGFFEHSQHFCWK